MPAHKSHAAGKPSLSATQPAPTTGFGESLGAGPIGNNAPTYNWVAHSPHPPSEIPPKPPPVGLNKGLKIRARLMIDTDIGRTAFSFVSLGLKLGGSPGLSIGFISDRSTEYVDAQGCRHFTKCQLKEVSICTFQAASRAVATSVKESKAGSVTLHDEIAEVDRERQKLKAELREAWELLNALVTK